MNGLLILLSAVVMAQDVPPQPATPKPVPPKPAARKTGTARPKSAVKPKPVSPPAPMTDDEKTVYALGLTMFRSLGQFDLTAAELELVRRALADAYAGKPEIDFKEWGPKIQALATTRSARVSEREKAASQAYLNQAAAELSAVKTDSGLIYRELRPGTGASPKVNDTVKVNYRGTLINGTEFDSSYARNEPAQFPLTGVIRCWTEGLQKMKVGGKSMLVCPSDLAYGEAGRPSIPPGATLIFEIELLDIPASAP